MKGGEEYINKVCEEAARYGERLIKERLSLSHLGDYNIVVTHDPDKKTITVDIEITVSRRLGFDVKKVVEMIADEVIRYVDEKIKDS